MEDTIYKGDMLMRELICMIGASGSGKSTAARILEKTHGYTYVTSSDYIRQLRTEIENCCGHSVDTNILIGMISKYYEHGFNGFMRDVFERVNFQRIVWDSCININNLDQVISCFDRVYYLCMTAPLSVRMKRIAERGSYPGRNLDEVTFITANVDKYERNLGLGELMLQGDWYISAETNDELKIKLCKFLSICQPSSVEQKISNLKKDFTVLEIKQVDIDAYLRYMNSEGSNL